MASLRIEGPSGVELLAELFSVRRPLAEVPLRQIVVGRIGGEEVVISRISEEAIELHCHGGSAAVARLDELLVGRGCCVISWQDWAAAQQADPLPPAAACIGRRPTNTDGRHPVWTSTNGALPLAFEQIEAALKSGDAAGARWQAEALLAHALTGLHLVKPWQVVIAGRPNVGKSSLINAIAGYQRAIVHSQPGTTRDIVTVQTALDGWPVEISDTAGLRESNDAIEQAGIELARKKIAAADLIVLVFDASLPWTDADQALVVPALAGSERQFHLNAELQTLLVANKCDLPPATGPRPAMLTVSAATSAGSESSAFAVRLPIALFHCCVSATVPFLPDMSSGFAATWNCCYN